jgi:MGT family glycosyltransferase
MMSHVLVAATPIDGHAKPMITIAAHLKCCGHKVTFNSDERYRSQAEASGVRFVPLFGKASQESLDERLRDRQKLTGDLVQLVNFDIKHIFGDPIPDQYRGLRDIAEKEPVDIILADAFFLGIFPYLLGPKESRPPIISFGTFAMMLQTDESSFFAGVDRSPEGRKRNREHNEQQMKDMNPGNEHINAILQNLGSRPIPGFLINDAFTLADLHLQCGTREFEFGLEKIPAKMRFVGPLVPHSRSDFQSPAWLEELDNSKPVVFVTQGTLANLNFDQLVNPALAGLADENVMVVATAGGGEVSAIQLRPNARVDKYLPYDRILPKTAVFVTNAGYNGVQQALSMGVPIVAAGATEDKPHVAARLEWTGAGINLKTGNPTPEQIRDAVRAILRNPEYKKRAEELQRDYANHDALKSVEAAVEELLAVKVA